MTNLFNYPNIPGYRRTGTSQDAAADMKKRAPSLREQVLSHITRCPQTVHEVAAVMGKTVPSVQPRFSELEAMGLIEESPERRKNESGKWAIVWKAK